MHDTEDLPTTVARGFSDRLLFKLKQAMAPVLAPLWSMKKVAHLDKTLRSLRHAHALPGGRDSLLLISQIAMRLDARFTGSALSMRCPLRRRCVGLVRRPQAFRVRVLSGSCAQRASAESYKRA